MSSPTQADRSAKPFKILSLDDGGVCGLSSLLILEKIMEDIRATQGLSEIPKPCDIFDLIGGTGTGGISAIMLGRLGMPISDCIEAYKEICKAAFTPTQQTWLTRFKTKGTSNSPTIKLENAVKKVIQQNDPISRYTQQRGVDNSEANECQHEDQRFLDDQCVKTVVLATTKVNANALPTLFRTYEATTSLTECKIWEVARATSAMVNVFEPIKLGRDNDKFINSSFGYSNPCKIIITEAAKFISSQQETLIVSIGTGLGGVVEISDTKKSLKTALKKMATNSQRVEHELKEEYSKTTGVYYRFNTEVGLRDISPSHWVDPAKVSAHTKNHLNQQKGDIKKFVMTLGNTCPPVTKQSEKPDGPVPMHYVPFDDNPYFVGRQEVLCMLEDKLFTPDSFQQIALMGLGGMGKTQVALKLAHTVKEKHPDYSVFWLTAASIDGFRDSCKKLAEMLKLETADGDDPRILVRNYLKAERTAKWLLILDNVDDTSFFDTDVIENRIGHFLPRSDQGRILLTTRSKRVAQLAARKDVLELEGMSSKELSTLLSQNLNDVEKLQVHDEAQVNSLLNELCHLPLAVAQAADYMAINNVSISEYLELLKETEQSKIELLQHSFVDNVHIDRSQGAVATAWYITFQQIQKASPDAVKLLRFIAYIDSKAIPQSIFPNFERQKQMVDAIGILVGYGFLRKQNVSGIFDMHSLVHFTTQLWCKDLEDKNTDAVAVLSHMTSIFPSDEWENRFLWRQYLPHALCVVKIEKGSEGSISELAFKVSQCLQRDGYVGDAVGMLENVFKTREKALAADHPSRLESQRELAKAYLANGQVKEAVSMLEHVVEVEEEALAADHPSRLASQHELAGAYLANGQVEEAVSMLGHVVEVEGEALAADHPSRLASQHALAGAYLANGQVKEAVSMLEHVFRTREKALAADHPSRLESQHALAGAYLANGQVKEAVSMLEHVVRTKEKALAADHPSRLASQHELARAYLANGQVEEAVSMLGHVVEVEGEALAADHPSRLASQHALAGAYLANGQVKEAVSMLEHVVRTREKALAADHPSRLESQHELAGAYLANGQVKEAVSMLEHVVEVQEKALAADHPSRLTSQHELARAYYATGKCQIAIELLQRVVKIDSVSSKRTYQQRMQAQQLLESWLASQPHSQDTPN